MFSKSKFALFLILEQFSMTLFIAWPFYIHPTYILLKNTS